MLVQNLANVVRPRVSRNELREHTAAFLSAYPIPDLPLTGVQALVEGVRSLEGLAMQKAGKLRSHIPIMGEALHSIIDAGDPVARLEFDEHALNMVAHTPVTIQVSGAEATLLDRGRHHDKVDEVQELRPLLRKAPRNFVEEKPNLLINLPMDRFTHSDFLGSVRGWDPMVDAHQGENLLEDG